MSQDLIFVCAGFARIRRLRKSLQYFLVISQWKITVSANLHNSLQNFTIIAQTIVKILARGIPCARVNMLVKS